MFLFARWSPDERVKRKKRGHTAGLGGGDGGDCFPKRTPLTKLGDHS